MTEEEKQHLIAELLGPIMTFLDRTTEDCPHCGNHATSCEQVGRSIYARPCGCRVVQGHLHENWKTDSRST